MCSGVRDRVGKVFCGLGKHDWKTIYRWRGIGYGFAGFLLGVEWDWVAVGSKCRRCGHEVRL